MHRKKHKTAFKLALANKHLTVEGLSFSLSVFTSPPSFYNYAFFYALKEGSPFKYIEKSIYPFK